MKLQQAHSRVAWWHQAQVTALRVGALAVLAAITISSVAGQVPANRNKAEDSQAPTVAGAAAGPNQQVIKDEPQTADTASNGPSTALKKPVVEDSAKLLQMAMELKVAVDKTTKDTLSMQVIHQAVAIEKLAHSVKENKRVLAGAK